MKNWVKQDDDLDSKLRVWVAEVETGKAKPLFQSPDMFLNAVFDKYGPFSAEPCKIGTGRVKGQNGMGQPGRGEG